MLEDMIGKCGTFSRVLIQRFIENYTPDQEVLVFIEFPAKVRHRGTYEPGWSRFRVFPVV